MLYLGLTITIGIGNYFFKLITKPANHLRKATGYRCQIVAVAIQVRINNNQTSRACEGSDELFNYFLKFVDIHSWCRYVLHSKGGYEE